MKKKANIYDVAERAGVSHQTVSRVMNNHASVKPATREKVERAIIKLSYRPNPAARQLVTSQSRMIGLLVADLELYGPSSMLIAIEREARVTGYSVITIPVVRESRASWLGGIEHLKKLDIDGVITIALTKEVFPEIKKALRGVAIVGLQNEPSKDADVVNVDNLAGGKMATQYLIDLGHTEIVHISGPVKSYEANMRKLGYTQAMKGAGFKPVIEAGNWSMETGFEIGKKIFAGANIPTAIFCANDHLAIGVIKATSKSLRVPNDLSLVGFDDVPESSYLTPSLTTVKQNFEDLGKIAINRILTQMKNPIKSEIFMTNASLIVSESTQPPKSGKKK
jgi:DNA-binding LacI/PurR family transcriptional regulator